MEFLLKWLDDFDDLFAVVRLQAGPVLGTVALLVVFVTVVAAVFVLGPPQLLAAP